MTASALDDLLAIIRRDLGASDARVLDPDEDPGEDDAAGPDRTLRCVLPGRRELYVTFDTPPADLEARRRRLELLVSSFEGLLAQDAEPGRAPRPARPTPPHALDDELAALVRRAGACGALVIDARSPVIWSTSTEGLGPSPDAPSTAPGLRLLTDAREESAYDEVTQLARRYGLHPVFNPLLDVRAVALLPRALCERHRVVPLRLDGHAVLLAMADPTDADAVYDVVLHTGLQVEPLVAREANIAAWIARHPPDDAATARTPEAEEAARELATAAREGWSPRMASRRAVAAVRADPALPQLHRGGHLHAAVAEDDFGYLARSFAGIYVLILVFDGPYQDLATRRAVAHALPLIERLVAAMPPRDPGPPLGRVMAMRRRRR